jgi:hypothetical protein
MAGLPPTISDGTVTLTFGAAGQYYGYCTIADVGFEFPDKSSFTTLQGNAGNSVIAQEITYAAQELQEQLALKYQMPYVGADAGILLRMRELNAKLATSNIIDRYFQADEPNLSPAAAERRSYAELVLTDILDGNIQWASPFGDAVAMAEKPLYPLSAGASIQPDPLFGDQFAQVPIFVMGRTRFRPGSIF